MMKVPSPNTSRVGILTTTNDKDEINICDRWATPFIKAGMEIEYIPAGAKNLDEILSRIHGLLLPGGDTNIHPLFYDPSFKDKKFSARQERDISRDRTAIELVQKTYDKDIPTLGICRGMQEMMVAFGGQLQELDKTEINHAQGYENAPMIDGQRSLEALDTLVHDITLEPGGVLDDTHHEKTFMVNSVHTQGMIKKIWDSPAQAEIRETLMIEALAPDGVIEAISVQPEKNKRFFVGLQAHFELPGPLHISIFTPFRRAIRDYASTR